MVGGREPTEQEEKEDRKKLKELLAKGELPSNFDYDAEIELIKKEDARKRKEQQKIKKAKEKASIQLSCFEDTNNIYEQIYDQGLIRFARYNRKTGEIDYIEKIETEFEDITPIIGEEVTKRAVLLPSKAEPYDTEETLDNEILTFINKWLDIPADIQKFALWNIKRSWIYQRFHTLNYLRAMGDTGQGKSRFLDTIGSLHYKPIFASGATTSAPVFRIIDKWKGTMIFDEADFKFSDETQEIIKIINQGYERGKFVMRCDQNDATKVQFFDPFCPKVLATRKPFQDKAVESRCITHVMMGTKRRNIVFTLTDEFFNESQQLRNKLLTWRFLNYDMIDSTIVVNAEFGDLEPRVQQIVSSYISLFGRDKTQMEAFKTFIEGYQSDLIQERADSWQGQIAKAIYDLFNEGELYISANDIINKADLTDSKGNLVKPRALISILKELGFGKSEMKRIGGKIKRCIPLDPEHLKVVFARYGCNDVTFVTMYTKSSDKTESTEKSILDYEKSITDVTVGELSTSTVTTVDTVTDDVPNESEVHPPRMDMEDFESD